MQGVTNKVKNVLGGGHGHNHGTGVTGPHAGTTTTPANVVHKVENAVTGHGTHAPGHGHTGGTGMGATHTPGAHTSVMSKVENAVGAGHHGTTAPGTHASGPAALLEKAKLKVTGHH